MMHRFVSFSHSFSIVVRSDGGTTKMIRGATGRGISTTTTTIQRFQRRRFFSTLDDLLDGGYVDRMLQELDQQLSTATASTLLVDNSKTTTSRNKNDKNKIDDKNNNGWLRLSDLHIEIDDPSKQQQQQQQQSSTSPVHEYKNVFSSRRSLHVKRDDLLRLPNSNISGNKGRKMWLLNCLPSNKFPRCIVSYGGPQSNSMVALAAIVNSKNRCELLVGEENGESIQPIQQPQQPIRFVYYTKKLPRFLKNQPSGNLFRALALGIQIIELSHQEYSQMFESHFDDYGQPPIGLVPPLPGSSVWVPQGGASQSAQTGVNHLAHEVYEYWKQHGDGRPLTVCVPGGTCTTAVFLHHGIKKLLQSNKQQKQQQQDVDNDITSYAYDDNDSDVYAEDDDPDIEVVVIPCVGDALYARRQMMSLSVQIGADPADIPTILQPGPEESSTSSSSKPQKYFPFGQPNQEILDTFQELQDKHGIVVDLIYGAPSFAIMFRHLRKDRNGNGNDEERRISPDITFDPNQPLAGREIMYVHSGGLEGINSQLLRYKYEGMVEIQDVQVPGKNANRAT
jgi:1-aminocyclopropane-1-carboxylate deaminase/D-cysteine desulfhydrase-like pyridoxal-dependent ACC family enzyme